MPEDGIYEGFLKEVTFKVVPEREIDFSKVNRNKRYSSLKHHVGRPKEKTQHILLKKVLKSVKDARRCIKRRT